MNDARKLLATAWLGGMCLGLCAPGCDKPAPAPTPPAPTPPPAPAPKTKELPKALEPTKDVLKVPAPPEAVKVVAKDLPLPPDLVQFKSEIAKATAQIDLVVSRLDVLASSTKDLEKPHADFNAALAGLDTETAAVRKRADEMRERGAAYFEAWEKGLAAMSTPEVKDLAAKRKTELSAKYTELLAAMQETRAAYDPFAAGLKEIQTKLDDTLTPESIKLLAPAVTKARDLVKTIKDRIAKVQEKLGNVSGLYTQP